ncbi:MAG: hypothetical protein NVV59_05675 [Chitinophagaceae bacterium]|nr:hypothetical protein [Chitinophagaceae bacterium]
MKKLYLLLLTTTLLLSACSKDFLKSYENRIDGEWRLTDIDRRGIGSSRPMPLKVGDHFIFGEDGSMTFTRTTGEVYDGSWDISREYIPGGCYTNEYGDYVCDSRRVKTLSLAGIDFNNQDYFSIHFDEMVFTGTNRFKAFIYEGGKTYIFRFRR